MNGIVMYFTVSCVTHGFIETINQPMETYLSNCKLLSFFPLLAPPFEDDGEYNLCYLITLLLKEKFH